MASSILSRRSSLQTQTQSKAEVLQWVSFVLGLKVTKLEQLQSGALYCQILDAYEGKVNLHKVNFEAHSENDYIPNYKQLQHALTACGANQDFDWQRMMKSPVANWHFVKWLAQRYDGREPLPGYDPAAQRQEAANGRRTSSGALAGTSGWSTPQRSLSLGRGGPWGTPSRGAPSVLSSKASVSERPQRPPPPKREYSGPGAWRPSDVEAQAMPSFVTAISSTPAATAPASAAASVASEQASSEASSSQQGYSQQWDASRPATTGFSGATPFAAWSPAQPELPLPPGDRANQKPPWQPVSRSPSQGPGRRGSSTIPAGRLLSTSASLLSTADHTPPPGGRLLPTRRDREAMSSMDPEQVGVLGNAGGVLLQADEAGQAAVTVVLRSLQDLERLVKEASSKDVRDGAGLRAKVHMRRGQLGRTIQQTWVLLQDLHQLSAVQGGKIGRARARRMESLMKELDCSEKQWLEVCGQIDKLDKFFPLGAVALSRARDAQAAAIARGISDTRQLDSVLRSVDQAQAGLSTVFEALPTLDRRSLIYTPMQLRQVPQLAPSMQPPLAPSHTKGALAPPLAPAFGPTRITPSKPPLSLAAATQPATPSTHRGRPTYTSHLARTASAVSDSPSVDEFEGASASVLRKWGMLKETEEESESSDGGTDELVNVLDSAADLRVQPADKQASTGVVGASLPGGQAQTQPVHEVMPSPCMPSPSKTRLATPKQAPWAGTPPSKKKRSMAWICCKASPTKPEYEESARVASDGGSRGAPCLERLSNGDTFKGQYAEGVRQGHAVYRFANGDLYEGQFVQDRMHGSGVYTFAHEGRFAGQWVGGLYQGLGCEAFAQGSTYSGNFQHGRRHGFGVCEYHNGDYYEGEWQAGVRQGLGMQQCSDNSNYAGQYSRGLRHGFGAYSFPNGDRYLGQCDSDVPHGYGTYLFATGQAYEGQWARGKKHGWCVYTVEDGQQWAGKWQEGRPRWVEHLQQERSAQQAELAGLGSHAAAVDLCLEAARMARDAGVEGALRAEQHWLPHGTMQVNIQATTKASQQAKLEAEAAQSAAQML
ncbi:hypothetical protein ABBQ32_001942 [Trebouxia sp. C0010 RCD-2024]